MKIRLISTFVIIASLASVALAQRGISTHIITNVRDDMGRTVQGATVRVFGPFGYTSRRNDFSSSTDRSGVADQSVLEGRYLVFAYDDRLGSNIKTVDANDRSGINQVDLQLRPTRRPTIQVVLMSDDTNEPIGGANIEVICNETGRRDDLRSNSNGITPYDIPGSIRGGRFDVAISSRDYDTVTRSLSFRPRSDSGTMVYYVQLHRKTATSARPGLSFDRNRYTLDGLITINVGLQYGGGTASRTRGRSTVTVTQPDGSRILNQTDDIDLPLNQYSSNLYDIRLDRAGTYTVTVRADGENNSHWTGRYTFVVYERGRGNNDRVGSDVAVTRGDYIATSDIQLDNRNVQSHQIQITLVDTRNVENIKGWLAPRRGEGFHITFKGSFDYSRNRLDATGTMQDRNDKRWDIRLTGSPDRNGKIAARLTVRALDNSYNQTFNFTLAKR